MSNDQTLSIPFCHAKVPVTKCPLHTLPGLYTELASGEVDEVPIRLLLSLGGAALWFKMDNIYYQITTADLVESLVNAITKEVSNSER